MQVSATGCPVFVRLFCLPMVVSVAGECVVLVVR